MEERTPSLVDMGYCSLSTFNNVKPNEFKIVGGMVVYLSGPKGAGKTTLLACLANQKMLPPESDDKVMVAREEAAYLRRHGFKKALIPRTVKHTVYSDTKITTAADQGYLPRKTWQLDVDRMKIAETEDDFHGAQFFPYGATIIIDELMSIWDARDFNKKDKGLPEGTRAFLQFCRHRGIAVITGCLLASGSDKRFRQMSQNILLIVHRIDDMEKGVPVKTTWYCLEFATAEACDQFLNGKDNVFFKKRVFCHYGNIRQCVDSYAKNDEFIRGMENRAIEFKEAM